MKELLKYYELDKRKQNCGACNFTSGGRTDLFLHKSTNFYANQRRVCAASRWCREVKILVDFKNHLDPIDINEVESIAGMVEDVGAKNRANTSGIQLYKIYDQSLGNTNLFIPLRYVAAGFFRRNAGSEGAAEKTPVLR